MGMFTTLRSRLQSVDWRQHSGNVHFYIQFIVHFKIYSLATFLIMIFKTHIYFFFKIS